MEESGAGLGVVQAATRLGISVDAVRKRIRRRTLRAYKVDGEWRIILDAPAATDQSHDQAGDQDDRPGPDQGAASSLIAQVQSEVAFLRQLTEHQAGVIAQQAQTIESLSRRVELPVSRDPSPDPSPRREGEPSPAALGREGSRTEPAPHVPTARPQRRSWWRRWLGR